ncbi:hypothetical protein FOA52_015369 [Chlamydomonas sp. UWO 241]|nr:hypothetical protein FOA52_015369 [Chlamydomonas sp. UWO 241]
MPACAGLPKGAYEPSKALDHLLGLGLATCMEAGVRRAVANKLDSHVNSAQAVVTDMRGCVLLLEQCIGHGSLSTGSAATLSLAMTLRKLLTAMVVDMSNALAFNAVPTPGTDAQLRSQCNAALTWSLLPGLLGCMDAFCSLLASFSGHVAESLYEQTMQLLLTLAAGMDGSMRGPTLPETLGPEGRVLFRHMTTAHPRLMQVCVRISEKQPQYARMMQRYMSCCLRPTAGVPLAAGADYALLQLPDWSALRKAAGCSNPRCLNAARGSEASLPTMKCGKPSNMATPSLPNRDAAREAIASFVKLARSAPSAKGSKAAELFDRSLPIALAKVGTTTRVHASSSNAAARAAVKNLSKEGFYSALARVVDLLRAAPERRLAMPVSTVC